MEDGAEAVSEDLIMMLPAPLKSSTGEVTIVITTSGNVPATAFYVGGVAITPDGKLYVVQDR